METFIAGFNFSTKTLENNYYAWEIHTWSYPLIDSLLYYYSQDNKGSATQYLVLRYCGVRFVRIWMIRTYYLKYLEFMKLWN